MSAQYPKLEERHRAALISEADDEAAALGEDPDADSDGEAAEVRRLRESVRLSDYLSPAAGGVGLSGATAS